jgi:hypothetical protein
MTQITKTDEHTVSPALIHDWSLGEPHEVTAYGSGGGFSRVSEIRVAPSFEAPLDDVDS